jgi:hypothetical protein
MYAVGMGGNQLSFRTFMSPPELWDHFRNLGVDGRIIIICKWIVEKLVARM